MPCYGLPCYTSKSRAEHKSRAHRPVTHQTQICSARKHSSLRALTLPRVLCCPSATPVVLSSATSPLPERPLHHALPARPSPASLLHVVVRTGWHTGTGAHSGALHAVPVCSAPTRHATPARLCQAAMHVLTHTHSHTQCCSRACKPAPTVPQLQLL